MVSTKITITGKTQIGFSWTNSVEQVWNSNYTRSELRVCEPADTPSCTGTIRQVLKELESVAKNNSGNYWRKRWFVKIDGNWVEFRFGIWGMPEIEENKKIEFDVEIV